MLSPPKPSCRMAAARPLYLHTSPEFAAKKLLAAGEEKIFEFARVFRNRERGRLHAPEFTMLEWYRARADYRAVIADTLALLRLAANEAGRTLTWLDRSCDPVAEAEWLTVADAFRIHAGIDLAGHAVAARHGRPRHAGQPRQARRIFDSPMMTAGPIFSASCWRPGSNPSWGLDRPTILYEYPRAEAALARPKPDDPRLAERFEIYACGVELANGFGELTDAGGTARPLHRRDGRKRTGLWRSAIRWTRISWRRWRGCRLPQAWRWASTGW